MNPSNGRKVVFAMGAIAFLLTVRGAAFAQHGVWGEIAMYPPPGPWREIDAANFNFIGMSSPIYRGWSSDDSVIYAIAFESQGMNFLQMHSAREELLRSMPEARDVDVQVVGFNGKQFSWVQAAGPAEVIGSAKKNSGKMVVNIWSETLYKDYVVRFTLSTPASKIATTGPQFQAFMESVECPFETRELTEDAVRRESPGGKTGRSQPNPTLIEKKGGVDSRSSLPPLPGRGDLDGASAERLDRIEGLLFQIKALLEELLDKEKTGPD